MTPTNYSDKARAHAKAEWLVKAAAGDMLTALEEIAASSAITTRIGFIARAAINKAKGV